MPATDLSLTTPIAMLPGVAADQAAAMDRMGLRCVADLLLHAPLRYRRTRSWQTSGAAAVAASEDTTDDLEVRGEVASVQRGFGRRPKIEVVLEDDDGEIDLVFFNQPWVQRRLHPGMRIAAIGRPRSYRKRTQIANPEWRTLEADATITAPSDDGAEADLTPVYSASDECDRDAIAHLIASILEDAVALLDDHLSDVFRTQRGLPTLADAYQHLHRPEDQAQIGAARRRLAFDELLMLQLGVMMKRYHRQTHLHAPPLPMTDDIRARILARIPFTPTGAQRRAMDETARDLTHSEPMNRLLQGDVGSGKTVVALAAMLQAVADGRQAAMVAPTELLAEQHERTLRSLLAGTPLRLAGCTGSLSASERTSMEQRIASGEIDIVVGTHAVLSERVVFKSLAIAVTDEQHRFGVHQRAALRDKSADPTQCPHQLVMTATPIPRTLSLTLFGDLDVSTIDELPPGRTPVETVAVARQDAHAVYEDVSSRVRSGERAFIVVPVIEESSRGLTDLTSHLDRLQQGPLREAHLAAMHGRLDREARDAIMDRFRQGDIDVLVATTVVEVGVDVPDATVMVVEDADRFGLAQLHQLRGRVGRGTIASRCVLIADPTTDEGRRRIEAMVETTDGFRIAERDLEIRGPGELFGARQSGMPPFRVATLPGDLDLLALARRDAQTMIAADPLLTGNAHALLRRRLLKAHGQWLGLGDVG